MTSRPQGISLSPSSVEAARALKPNLERYATRLRALDKDGNQILDLEEICEAMDEIVALEKQRRLLKWIAIFLAIFSILVTAATVGLTYAVVELSKDSKVTNNVLVTKSGDPLSVGKYHLAILSPDGEAEDITVAGGTIEIVNGTRRLLQAGQSSVACYKNYGRVEAYSINAICERVNGNDPTFVMRLKDSKCRTDGGVEVTGDQQWVAEGDNEQDVCPYVLIDVKVTKHFCHVLSDTSLACKKPIDDATKSAKTWDLVYGTGTLDGKNYKIEYKADCTSVTDPVFKNWFASGNLRSQVDCPPNINTNNGNSGGEITIDDGPVTILPIIAPAP